MRISDWSSDWCSSDLLDVFGLWHVVESTHEHRLAITGDQRLTRRGIVEHPGQRTGLPGSDRGQLIMIIPVALGLISEERRVGKECVRTCRSWRSPFH